MRRFFATMANSINTNQAVLAEQIGNARFVTLNRPSALNALNLEMIQAMDAQYQEIMRSSHIGVVVLRGTGEKAFCAGGDVVGIHFAGKLAKVQPEKKYPAQFFREEYHVDYTIACLNKPHVAIIDGITMGGGVGVSVHGTFRVATERSLFAMPETGIGLFPDVGGSYFLPRLRLKHYGRHLALTGGRVKGAALKSLGVATHCVPSSALPALYDALAALPALCSVFQVANTIAKFETPGAPSEVASPADLAKVERLYESATFDSFWRQLRAMSADGDAWATATASTIETMSPTSVKVTYEQMQRGATMSLADCLEMEFVLVQKFLREHDFYEGVRAQLVDKDRKPKWSPASLDQVGIADVASYFSMHDDYEQLRLPQFKNNKL